jgi:Heavy-metal resistance
MTPSIDTWCRERRGHMTSYALLLEATNGSEEDVMKTFAAFLVAIFIVAPLSAQQSDPVAVVAHVLDLSSDQITAWSAILHARQAAIEPLYQQAEAQEQAIAQALGSANPDPLAIGQAVVALHALQVQIGQANAQGAAAFEKLLTADQLQRLSGIRGAAQACPIVPAFAATGLL